MINLYVGQKVVCIDDSKNGFSSCPLLKGQIYTVSKVVVSPIGNTCIWTKEAHGGWYAKRFRPVVERKTDISIFTAMLDTQRTGVPA